MFQKNKTSGLLLSFKKVEDDWNFYRWKKLFGQVLEEVNPTYDMKDTIYRDIPSVDNSLFILARNLILAK